MQPRPLRQHFVREPLLLSKPEKDMSECFGGVQGMSVKNIDPEMTQTVVRERGTYLSAKTGGTAVIWSPFHFSSLFYSGISLTYLSAEHGASDGQRLFPAKTGVSLCPLLNRSRLIVHAPSPPGMMGGGVILTVAPRRNFPKLPPGNESCPDLASRAAGRVLPALDARRMVRGFS